MDTNELKQWMRQLRKSYKVKYVGGIVEALDQIIKFLLDDLECYPPHIQRGIEFNLRVFCTLRDRADNRTIVDYDAEWVKFRNAADDLAYKVFTPWIQETTTQLPVPFTWNKGGDA